MVRLSNNAIPVVDIFAGPGGLGEGFSGDPDGRFRLVVSAEMEKSAHATLLMRAYFRALPDHEARLRYYYPLVSRVRRQLTEQDLPNNAVAREAFRRAVDEALNLELGKPEDDAALRARVREAARADDRWVLIGGPPCQAYSIAGRVRNRGNANYVFEQDGRSHLYRHYLGLIRDFGPAVFVMENVKGMLSARMNGQGMFQRIVDDLHDIRHAGNGYHLYSVVHGRADQETDPDSFIVRCEQHGVPQARHRVIIIGVREDIARTQEPGTLAITPPPRLDAAQVGLPALRSTISRAPALQRTGAWVTEVREQYRYAERACRSQGLTEVADFLKDLRTPALELDWQRSAEHWSIERHELLDAAIAGGLPRQLAGWLIDPDMPIVTNHEARGHMQSDLGRYAFAAAFRQVHHRSPVSRDYPATLAPAHYNWKSGAFADRFFVQPPEGPSSTITSHIAKDGHHFIHWDPAQCRSFTVREAARVQTFPDNYIFLGNRTEQFTQVGNAVPPLVASHIADAMALLFQSNKALRNTENVVPAGISP